MAADIAVVIEVDTIQRALDLTGVFTFGLSGGLMAVRKGFDVVGIGVLAILTALGGGIIRDLLIDAVPPAAFTQPEYLWLSLAAAVVVFFAHRLLERVRRAVLVFDAAGLGLFAVAGTIKASDAGLAVLQAALLGTISAVGGGVLRDVVARETPALVRSDSTLYSVPAFTGALAVATLSEVDAYTPAAGIVVVLVVFAWRLAALRFEWHAPTAFRRPRG